MYPYLSELLSDHKGGVTFTCFGIWHILYMIGIFGAIIAALLVLRGKSADVQKKAVRIAINCAFGLYIADFFLMPFAYGEIDLEKLPFHACTATCVLCFLSHRNRFLEKYRLQFALLGLASNLIYVVYPAGIAWYGIHPLSYRALQTLLFHGTMSAYGVLVLAFDEPRPRLEWRRCRRDLAVIVAMTLWALFGNTLYNGTSGEYSHFFNWFFVVRDPFYLLPEGIAPYIMPFVMIAVMFTAELLIYGAYFGVRKLSRGKDAEKS